MPRFFFHLSTGDGYERDEIGSELADANEAYLEAFETAQQLSVDLIRQHLKPTSYRFDICDEQDRIVFQLPFTEIVGHRLGFHEMTAQASRGHSLASELRDQIVTARTELQTLWMALKRI